MKLDMNIKKINKSKITNSTETFFNISITRIQQIFSLNPNGFKKLIKNAIPFDLFLICSINPYDIDKFIYSRKIQRNYFIKEIIYCFCYDLINLFKIINTKPNNKKIIISSKRWVKNTKIYEKELRNIFKDDFCKNTKFIYFSDKKPKAINKYSIKIREGIYQSYLDYFDELSEKYIISMNKKYKYNFNNLKKIKNLIKNNQKINIDKNIPNPVLLIIIENLYKFINFCLLKYIKNKEIFIINTNLWSVGNLLIDQLILNKEACIIGCQHGGGYGEREKFNQDLEIYCPSFADFLGFGLFKKNINPSIILNLKDSFQKGSICYICGPSFNSNKELFSQDECLSLIDKLAKKYFCSIRVHPKDNFEKVNDLMFKHLKNIEKINIFKANTKFESISIYTKICIFDYPHSTLFWEAKSKGLKTILIFDLKAAKSISKKLLKMYDVIIDSKNYNCEDKIIKYIYSYIENYKNTII